MILNAGFHGTIHLYLTFIWQQPQILLLKEGTDSSQGKPQLISNINACQAVAEAVCTTLGPRGMDKLIVDANGKGTVSNDGATILKLLDIIHPAAKTLVDIAKSQDAEVRIMSFFKSVLMKTRRVWAWLWWLEMVTSYQELLREY